MEKKSTKEMKIDFIVVLFVDIYNNYKIFLF